jgi:3'-phosphoadenosine 5'-phosphosulfate (PAPS) 3'-phosphatase
MNDRDLDELLDYAHRAARAGAALISSRRGIHGVVQTKDGATSLASSVVTEVDRAAQAAILEVIKPTLGDFRLGLLAEEDHDDGSRLRSPAFWCIDPLDGTLPFIEGRAGFAVSVALVAQDGTPLIGVCIDPVTGICFDARRGGGARRDGQPFEQGPGDGRLRFYTDPSFTQHPRYPEALAGLGPIAQALGLEGVSVDTSGGAVMYAMWSIERGQSCYFKFPKPSRGGGSSWDYAASSCIYRELGLPVGDMAGRPLPLNGRESTFMNGCGVCYATSQAIADALYGLARRLL